MKDWKKKLETSMYFDHETGKGVPIVTIIETLLEEERERVRKDVKELLDRYAYNSSEPTAGIVIDVEILEEYLKD